MVKTNSFNVSDELPMGNEYAAICHGGLKWDYSQLGDAAADVREHAIQIKISERRASEAMLNGQLHTEL